MRTTLTLDDDVAARVKSEARRTGRPFKEIVNTFLRQGFAARKEPKKREPFRIQARSLGARPGLDFDNIGALLEQLEGPTHR